MGKIKISMAMLNSCVSIYQRHSLKKLKNLDFLTIFYGKITIFRGKIHYQWPCSIAILTYPEANPKLATSDPSFE